MNPRATQSQSLVSTALAVGICYALYRFVDKPAVKTAAVAVAAVIVAQRLPIVGAALA
jgi:hypothetical protein